jgi:NADPH:quinone reductase-like Zn-dependent oxidoreductase
LCGVVSAVGASAAGWQVGDRVLGFLAGGGYAQQVAVNPQMLIRLPDSWSFAEGAAIPEVWLTAFSNLFMEGGLQAGERVLLHAGGSGVGRAGCIPSLTGFSRLRRPKPPMTMCGRI